MERPTSYAPADTRARAVRSFGTELANASLGAVRAVADTLMNVPRDVPRAADAAERGHRHVRSALRMLDKLRQALRMPVVAGPSHGATMDASATKEIRGSVRTVVFHFQGIVRGLGDLAHDEPNAQAVLQTIREHLQSVEVTLERLVNSLRSRE